MILLALSHRVAVPGELLNKNVHISSLLLKRCHCCFPPLLLGVALALFALSVVCPEAYLLDRDSGATSSILTAHSPSRGSLNDHRDDLRRELTADFWEAQKNTSCNP